jgi:hypothetical protein
MDKVPGRVIVLKQIQISGFVVNVLVFLNILTYIVFFCNLQFLLNASWPGNVTNKGVMSIAAKVVIQMNSKLGGKPWTI